MQIEHRVFEFDVPEQELDRAQVGTRLKQMRGVRVAQQVGRDTFLQVRARRRRLTGTLGD